MTPWCPFCKTGEESKFTALSAEHFLPRFGFPSHPIEAWRCKDCGYVVTNPPLRHSPEFDAARTDIQTLPRRASGIFYR